MLFRWQWFLLSPFNPKVPWHSELPILLFWSLYPIKSNLNKKQFKKTNVIYISTVSKPLHPFYKTKMTFLFTVRVNQTNVESNTRSRKLPGVTPTFNWNPAIHQSGLNHVTFKLSSWKQESFLIVRPGLHMGLHAGRQTQQGDTRRGLQRSLLLLLMVHVNVHRHSFLLGF